MDDDVAGAGVGALDEPRRAAAGQHRHLPGGLAEPVPPHRELRCHHQGGRLEVVGAVGRGTTEVVPCPVHRRRRAVDRRGEQREGEVERDGSGSTCSPTPCTLARPPVRQNGTSAPSRAARARSVQPAHRSTAAASPEPPPSPAPDGMRLCRCTCAARSTAARARRTRLSSSTGTSAPAPSSTRPSPASNRSSSTRSIETISASMRWRPSSRTPVTRRDRVSLAGASTRSAMGADVRGPALRRWRPGGASPRG